MPKPIGPTIPKWLLGEELSRARTRAEVSQSQAAQRLDCSLSKIQKIEGGKVRMNLSELETLLSLYGITAEPERARFVELQRLGKQRGWWRKHGRFPEPFESFLGLETAATKIRSYELAVVPGLFQTEDYARALAAANTPDMTEEAIEREVQLKLDRQKQILDSDDPPEIWLVLDESVLHRQVGGSKVQRDQLEHLATLSRRMRLHVVPYDHGSHPGLRGPLVIFEFPDDLHSPVVYVEGQAGNLYMEKEEELERCNRAYNDILVAALSRTKSTALIKAIANKLT